jgi:hypothetical protein
VRADVVLPGDVATIIPEIAKRAIHGRDQNTDT